MFDSEFVPLTNLTYNQIPDLSSPLTHTVDSIDNLLSRVSKLCQRSTQQSVDIHSQIVDAKQSMSIASQYLDLAKLSQNSLSPEKANLSSESDIRKGLSMQITKENPNVTPEETIRDKSEQDKNCPSSEQNPRSSRSKRKATQEIKNIVLDLRHVVHQLDDPDLLKTEPEQTDQFHMAFIKYQSQKTQILELLLSLQIANIKARCFVAQMIVLTFHKLSTKKVDYRLVKDQLLEMLVY